MQNPFWNSAGPRFISRDKILNLARETAARIVSRHAEVIKILLFGSFAREDYGARSDLDFLIVVRHSGEPARERIGRFLAYAPAYPTDMLVYTERELQVRLSEGDPFLARALQEAIQLYP
jgi:predicted nucleotidyltransferase